MDINEYSLMAESGDRPGVRLMGIVVLGSMIPVCGFLTFLTFSLFG